MYNAFKYSLLLHEGGIKRILKVLCVLTFQKYSLCMLQYHLLYQITYVMMDLPLHGN